MDVLVLIDKLDDTIHNAKPVPLTDQVRVDKEEVYDILDQMRATIPEEIKQARWIVKERQEMLAEAKREAERIVKEARDEQIRLISEEEVVKQAERQAEEIVEDARAREREIRLGAEDYADDILNTLEVNLTKFIAAVQRGRDRLQGREQKRPKSADAPGRGAMSSTGRCLCGAVRYEVDGPLRDVVLCHCVECRRWHGHVCAATTACAERGPAGSCPTSAACAGSTVPRATRTRGAASAASAARACSGTRPTATTISIAAGTLDPPTGLRTVAPDLHRRGERLLRGRPRSSGIACGSMARYLHTCYRIGDIDRSVAFYEKLGFEETGRMPIGDEAINVFMNLPGEDPVLELTYNHGVDSYDSAPATTTSRSPSTTSTARSRALAGEGIEPEKPPYRPGGRTEGPRIAFVRDPDGYRVELIEA